MRHTWAPALAALGLACSACRWIDLARNAATYETVQRGEAANLVAGDGLLYVTLAEAGLAVLDAQSGTLLDTVPAAVVGGSADDIARDGDLLFVLDARPPGHVSTLSLADPAHPRLVTPPLAVPVGPFSGITAAHGLCLVSGGTSALTAWRYDQAGVLSGPHARADLGRGQPDVVLARSGTIAFVATHYWGPYFGLDLLRWDAGPRQLTRTAKLELDGAGFTSGGARPANFPIAIAEADSGVVLVAHRRGIAVVRWEPPATLALLRIVDLGGPAVSVAADAGRAAAAVAGDQPAVVLLEFSPDAARITRRVALAPGTRPGGIAFTAGKVALAARERGVQLIER